MKSISIFSLIAILFVVEMNHAYAQELLKDIFEGSSDGIGRGPVYYSTGDYVYFYGAESFSGDGLWRTQGTEASTIFLTPEGIGEVDYITEVDAGILFSARRDVYVTDGNIDGHRLIGSITGGFINQLVAINDSTAILIADLDNEFEVYKTNGGDDGLELLGSFPVELRLEDFSFYNESLVISESSTQFPKFSPVITDGTVEGTVTVSEYMSNLGVDIQPETARGIGDLLVAEQRGADYVVRNNAVKEIDIAGNIRSGATVMDKRYIQTSIYLYSYDTNNETTAIMPQEANFFADMIATDSFLYFIEDDDYVYEHDPITETAERISDFSIGGTNFSGWIKILDNQLFYWLRDNGGNELRAIDLTTKEEVLIDTVSITPGFVIVPEVTEVNGLILYSKLTSDLGQEWWISDRFTSNLFSDMISEEANSFPNPTSDRLQIELPEAGEFNVRIYNTEGKLMKSIDKIGYRNNTLDVSHFQIGNYFGVASANDGTRRYSFKFVKTE